MKYKSTYLLGVCVLIMALLCILSIDSPIRFDHQKAEREIEIKKHLIEIRTAEEKYRIMNGEYTGSFDVLEKKGLLNDTIRYIPYSDGKIFALQATTIIGKNGQEIPLMECSAEYTQYLQGLDITCIKNLVEEANAEGRFPGLKIGDIETPNNNEGNWE